MKEILYEQVIQKEKCFYFSVFVIGGEMHEYNYLCTIKFTVVATMHFVLFIFSKMIPFFKYYALHLYSLTLFLNVYIMLKTKQKLFLHVIFWQDKRVWLPAGK